MTYLKIDFFLFRNFGTDFKIKLSIINLRQWIKKKDKAINQENVHSIKTYFVIIL